jgi:hypothetical protein
MGVGRGAVLPEGVTVTADPPPLSETCESCAARGQVPADLLLCLTCGHVGCSDSSRGDVRRECAGQVVAETRRAVRVLVTSHPPVFCIPPQAGPYDACPCRARAGRTDV